MYQNLLNHNCSPQRSHQQLWGLKFHSTDKTHQITETIYLQENQANAYVVKIVSIRIQSDCVCHKLYMLIDIWILTTLVWVIKQSSIRRSVQYANKNQLLHNKTCNYEMAPMTGVCNDLNSNTEEFVYIFNSCGVL